jgi:hypothetical protein
MAESCRDPRRCGKRGCCIFYVDGLLARPCDDAPICHTCLGCGRTVVLDKAGTLRPHRRRWRLCPMSGRLPHGAEPIVED